MSTTRPLNTSDWKVSILNDRDRLASILGSKAGWEWLFDLGADPASCFSRVPGREQANFARNKKPKDADGVTDPLGVGHNGYPFPCRQMSKSDPEILPHCARVQAVSVQG